jgi:hypothetical protein
VQIAIVKRDLTQSRVTDFSWTKIGEQADYVMNIISEHDPQALKSAYHALFDSVVVGPEDDSGVRSTSYILNPEDWIPQGARCLMVEAEGIEPSSESLRSKGGYVLSRCFKDDSKASIDKLIRVPVRPFFKSTATK